ncbi:hypothetical protein N9B90_02065, partial [bacterium]|nr:hypothetical protein [bacterium]
MTSSRLVVAALVGWLLVGALAAAPQFVQGPSARYGHSLVYDSQRQKVVLFGGFSAISPQTPLGDLWEWDGEQWQDRTPASIPINWPSSRGYVAMAYDTARGVCVMFGGGNPSPLDDTWEWDGNGWTERVLAGPLPPSRSEHAMVYDPLRQRTLMFSGWNGTTNVDDFWEYDGVDWHQVVAQVRPNARRDFDMAFDIALGKVVLFGGFTNQRVDDLWTWDGVDWVDETPVPRPSVWPAARNGMGLYYDDDLQRIMMYGGNDGSQSFTGTWSWDGVGWAQLVPSFGPGVRIYQQEAITFDAARGCGVMFGGRDFGQIYGDTWTFDGAEWRPKLDYVTSPVNGNRYALTPPMTWQDAEDLAVLEGGHLATIRSAQENTWVSQNYGVAGGGSGQAVFLGLNDVAVEGQWVWSSGEPSSYLNWNPGDPDNYGPGQHYAVMLHPGGEWDDVCPFGGCQRQAVIELPGGPVADVAATSLTTTAAPAPVREQAVASLPSGGETASGPFFPTYELQGTDWNKQFSFINPMVRTGSTLLLDQARQNNVMFGGENPLGTKLADTWTYANGQWSYLTPSNAPSPRSHHAMAYDPTTDTGILFGGEDAFGAALADMWSWDGADWAQAAPATLPPARMRHGIVWDRQRDVLVLFGGTDGTTRLDDVWEWDGIDWAQITPAQPSGITYGPSARDGFVMAYDPLSQRVVVIGGETDSGCVDDFWSWDGIAWVKHFATSGGALPSARKGAQIFFDASANELRLHGGGCGSNYSDELWSFQLPVFARSEVIGVGCAGSNGVPTLDIVNGTTPV